MNDHDQKPTATLSRMPVAASAAPATTPTPPDAAEGRLQGAQDALEVGRLPPLAFGGAVDDEDEHLDAAGLDPLDGAGS